MAGPGELIVLPNDTACFYVDADHSYWRAREAKAAEGEYVRGKRLTGVTTVIKPIDFDPGKLLVWAARTQCLGIAELVSGHLEDPNVSVDDLRWLTSQESIWRELDKHQLTFESVRDKAAKRGTNVHKLALHALASGEPVPDFAGMTPEEKGYGHGVVEFWLDNDPKPLQYEQVVYSEELGVAGRFDLRAEIGNRVVLLDAKTSGYIGEKDHVQLAAYNDLATVCGFGGSEEMWILRLDGAGGYEVIPSEADNADFRAAVDVYRRRGRIRGKASDAWRKRQEDSDG